MLQACFQINKKDNVITALDDLVPGEVLIYGETSHAEIEALSNVNAGHKIALRDIFAGEDIVKYGVVIGEAIQEIQKGEWVHLQNMKSKYDSRSSKLDIITGAPTDTVYE